ncbi:MAG: cysteine-rich CWC family protein [Thermoplasmata archaeon YP2-bin.285]|uniref:Cysteine-rich CWC family protein n=1 Tax=Candidatus Sysuiplasma superficiale TaxID=2823368 RepID=A0A8J7YLE8_9ARCH|nr:cysteine-rich CWC family protein [Candidatus Sysuiplasma superficiale]
MTRNKRCELCGNEFVCGGLSGCWCRNISISAERRQILSSIAEDCVCRNCISDRK